MSATQATASRERVIEGRKLVKTYRLGDVEVRALRGVDLTIERGEFVAIMGASGSGKSTLMNVLGCLDQPTSGSYFFEGMDTATLDEPALARIRSRRVGFVFQSFNLLARTSAAENVALPLFYTGDVAGSVERVRSALHALGLEGRERSRPSQLSGGEQQRVAIARALINEPAILLADEPTGNLDSKTSAEIMATIRSFNRERGLTVVLVTHEAEMAAFADRIVTMRDGVIVSDEPRAARAAALYPQVAPPPAEVGSGGSRSLADAWSFARMALAAAGRTLASNKMRSALTMLGIFIGVTALITMVAVGQGANAAVERQIESLGTNLLVVLPGSRTSRGIRTGLGGAPSLTVEDADAIKQSDPAVANVAYQISGRAQVQYGAKNWGTSIQGVPPSYLTIRSWAVVVGRALTDEDERNASRVCLLGQTVVKNLFGGYQNPVGATIFIKNVAVEVVGVLAPRGQTGFGQDQDDTVLIPFTTAERKIIGVSSPTQPQSTSSDRYPTPPNPFGIQPKLAGYVNVIYVQARSTSAVPTALDQVSATLRERHRLQPRQDDDFAVRNISDVTQAAQSSSEILALLLTTVASISLLVGGIGIMNILLVSVTERTREIGIRMAIGARRTQVLMQFLVEAMLLSIIGGGAGIAMGIVIAQAVSSIAGWPTLLSPTAMLGGFLFSAVVGVFFGYYPARRAARLNPIEALRFE
jgi:macrolide transport system ATP-binding/permease protein